LKDRRKWGWNILAYFVYHIAGLCISQGTVGRPLPLVPPTQRVAV
jgi:hypothetical protein